jgi:hypothetical protein
MPRTSGAIPLTAEGGIYVFEAAVSDTNGNLTMFRGPDHGGRMVLHSLCFTPQSPFA